MSKINCDIYWRDRESMRHDYPEFTGWWRYYPDKDKCEFEIRSWINYQPDTIFISEDSFFVDEYFENQCEGVKK